jgi:putative ABC transport system permease protein
MTISLFVLMFRRFFKNLTHSLIILTGLVIGLTSAVLVFLWVKYEVSFDRFHPENDRVYAVMLNENIDGGVETYDETNAPLGDYFATHVPEIESFTRFDNTRPLITYGEKSLQRIGLYADTGFFATFHPVMVAGNPTSFSDNTSIVISKSLSQLLFNKSDALGMVITLNKILSFKVSGVFEDYPANSSMYAYSFVLPFNAKRRTTDEANNYYIKLRDQTSSTVVEKKINRLLKEYSGNDKTTSLLFPLTKWRLHWNFENGKISGGRIVYVIIFSITAVFILLMAIVNYINILTASASKRAREIGVRKMTGASYKNLVAQFLAESLLFVCVASVVSIGLAYLLLPLFNELTGISIVFSNIDFQLGTGLIIITIATGLLAGSYPAFLLSSFKPAAVLKGLSPVLRSGIGLRKSLVVFQFVLSLILIFSAIVMRQQTSFLLNKDLGFDKHNVINVWLPADFQGSLQNLKSEIKNHFAVLASGLSGASPMEVNGYSEVHWPGEKPGSAVYLNGVTGDHDMITALGLKLVAGRNFFSDNPGDSLNFIITKKTASILGFPDPIGQQITYTMFGERTGKIVGVIDDFQNEDIHQPVDPVIITYSSQKNLGNLFVRYSDGRMNEALDHVKKVFNKFSPDVPISYSFLDGDFERQFYQEEMLKKLSLLFTLVAFAIAGLGLYGLTMFSTQSRIKEIGVRKVLGASVSQILVLLSKDFLRPVLISFVIAFPIGYYLVEKFLEGYAWRISISVWTMFSIAGMMIAFVIAVVSFLSFKVAVKNPVDTLKTD